MHAHALLCIPELLGTGCYLRLVLHGCSPLEQQQLPILPGIFVLFSFVHFSRVLLFSSALLKQKSISEMKQEMESADDQLV